MSEIFARVLGRHQSEAERRFWSIVRARLTMAFKKPAMRLHASTRSSAMRTLSRARRWRRRWSGWG